MKVFYSRISTDEGQTHKRQLQNLTGFDYVFCDGCIRECFHYLKEEKGEGG